jgi:hypothetical protein
MMFNAARKPAASLPYLLLLAMTCALCGQELLSRQLLCEDCKVFKDAVQVCHSRIDSPICQAGTAHGAMVSVTTKPQNIERKRQMSESKTPLCVCSWGFRLQ